MKTVAQITGIILVGGKSTRMGSDKGLVRLEGKTFVERVAEAIRPLVTEIILVGDQAVYAALGYRMVEDTYKDMGPLAGLYSGLKACTTNTCLVLSCDVPLVQTALLSQLLDGRFSSYDAVIAQSGNQLMPLVGRYHKRCLKKCEELLQQGEKRMMRLLENLHYHAIGFDENQSLALENINTKAQLKKLNKTLLYENPN